MNRYLLCFIVVFMLWQDAPAQSSPRHSHKPVHQPALRDIRQVDFQNFTYHTDGESVRVSRGHGVYQSNGKETFSYSIEKVAVVYGDLTGDGANEAAVTLYYTGGGSGAFSKGFLFTLRNGSLSLLTTFEGGDRADGGIREVRIQDGVLWVQRNEPERMKDVPLGLCCPKYLITTKYHWDGRKLNQVGVPEKIAAPEEKSGFPPRAVGDESAVANFYYLLLVRCESCPACATYLNFAQRDAHVLLFEQGT